MKTLCTGKSVVQNDSPGWPKKDFGGGVPVGAGELLLKLGSPLVQIIFAKTRKSKSRFIGDYIAQFGIIQVRYGHVRARKSANSLTDLLLRLPQLENAT